MHTLITGASSGLGTIFADRFARRGHDLILVARRTDHLKALATRLSSGYGIDVQVIGQDLAREGAPEALMTEIERRGLEVDVLVNNAGFATIRPVKDSTPGTLEKQVQLNCVTPVGLAARVLPAMRERGRGTIINIASTGAYQPIPDMAVYAASKSLVLSFSEALWYEEKKHGIRVLAACPGPMNTEFFDNAEATGLALPMQSPDHLVDTTLKKLEGSAPSFIDGFANTVLAKVIIPRAPKKLVLKVAHRIALG